MNCKLDKYIGDTAFYKAALTVAVPIILQNFVTNFVCMLDNLMVGALGTESMTGVSIVNQLIFVFNLVVFGTVSGVGIFTAQYYGKNDNSGIRYTLRFKFILSFILLIISVCVFLFFDKTLISLFLHDKNAESVELTMSYAQIYLRIIVTGLAPFAAGSVLAGTLRETGDTLTPMLAGFTAVIVNCVFNWILIFGKLGAPNLGVKGAAIATVLSRYVEFAILAIYTMAKRHSKFPYIKGLFKGFSVPFSLAEEYTKKTLPLSLNELLWSGGMSVLGIAFSLHGLNVVAAYSISSTVIDLFIVVFLSMGTSIGIISGRLLGAEKSKEAVDTVRKLIVFSVFLSIVIGFILFLLSDFICGFYKTSDESKSLAVYFIKVSCCLFWIDAFANASYFTLRSGGKAFITFLFDSGTLWALSIPAAFLLYYAAHMSVYQIYPIVLALGFFKDIIGYILVKKQIWVKTII